MEKFFDACIKQIVQLIKRHIARIESQGSRPRVSKAPLENNIRF